jgi:hypothetical protein
MDRYNVYLHYNYDVFGVGESVLLKKNIELGR